MSTRAQMLTIADLCERWGGVSEDVVLGHIKHDDLPFVPLGRGKGRRPIYMFRLTAIEAWEARRERTRGSAAEAGAEPPMPAGTPPPCWDGKSRTEGRGKRRKSAAQ